MRLREFQAPSIKVRDLINALRSKFRLEQNGGAKRVYAVGNTGELGVVFCIDGSPRAIGITWTRGTKVAQTVYVWEVLDVDKVPDIAIDIPVDADLEQTVDQLSQFIKNPRIGVISGAMVEATAPANDEGDEASELAAVKNLSQKGAVMLMGRKSDGTLFRIPGVDRFIARAEQMLAAEEAERAKARAEAGGEDFDESDLSMEAQYADMEEKVRLVASGQSAHTKALLITGMPSAGKSFRVEKVLKELGLARGKGLTIMTGKITTTALYRTFIEQIDGLIVLDDADSVWDDDNAVNLMKGAFNTGAVREVSYKTQKSLPTSVMDADDRRELVDAMSRILRNKPLYGDLEMFAKYLKGGKLLSSEDDSEEAFEQDILSVQEFITRRLPDLIEFRGRVIFISNLDQKEFPEAMISRSFHIHMDFKDEEMLDFIERIAGTLEGNTLPPGARPLSDEERLEVISFIRSRLKTNGFASRVNFRFVLKAFDYKRGLSNWKRNIVAM